MTPDIDVDLEVAIEPAGVSVTLIALNEGAIELHTAIVLYREQLLLRIGTPEPLPLAAGTVVGVMTHGAAATEVSLALVADRLGPTVTELRSIEARRPRPA